MAGAVIQGIESFRTDLRRASEALGVTFEIAMRKVVMDVLRGAVLRTPVDTGALAGNWQVTEGASSSAEQVAFAGGSGAALARAMGELASVRFDNPFSTWWISNPLPYAPVVEFGGYPPGPGTSGGYSLKAPAGMLRVTLAEVEAMLDSVFSGAAREAGL